MKTMNTLQKNLINIGGLLTCTILLSACAAADRLANVGQAPEMTQIQNPQLQQGYKPVSLPMPPVNTAERSANSLWSPTRQTFFKDQRATGVGDILTVLIDIDDQAAFDNESSRSRNSAENAGLDNFLGYENSLGQILPEDVVNTDLIGLDADSNHRGTGSIEREEQVELRLAALITQLLPNGNMVIQGRQEVRVNFEKRILELAGVIRPQDITSLNTISYDQIAEARISYGGEGQITDVQQPRYGQQVFDVLFPF